MESLIWTGAHHRPSAKVIEIRMNLLPSRFTLLVSFGLRLKLLPYDELRHTQFLVDNRLRPSKSFHRCRSRRRFENSIKVLLVRNWIKSVCLDFRISESEENGSKPSFVYIVCNCRTAERVNIYIRMYTLYTIQYIVYTVYTVR